MEGFSSSFQRSMSSPTQSIDEGGVYDKDGLSMRRKRFQSKRSISMATVQAQVSLAQSLHSMFHAAHDPHNETDTHLEDAWLQAVYNAVVFSIFGVVLCIAIAVYFILEPFLHPILWAVLVGTFIFPFKRAYTTCIEKWLTDLDDNNIPLVAGIIVSPLSFFNYILTKVEAFGANYWKQIGFLIGTTISLYFVFKFSLFYHFLEAILLVFHLMNFIITYIETTQIFVIATGLPLLIWYTNYSRHNHSSPLFVKPLVIGLWYLVITKIGTIFLGAMGIPLVTVLFGIAGLGYIVGSLKKSHSKAEMNTKRQVLTRQLSGRRSSVFSDAYNYISESIVKPGLGISEETSTESIPVEEDLEKEEVESVVVNPPSEGQTVTKRSVVRFKTHDELSQSPKPDHGQLWHSMDSPTPHPPSYDDDKSEVRRILKFSVQDVSLVSNKHSNPSNQVFLVLLTLCSMLILLHHPWLLLISPLFGIGWCMKQLMFLSVTEYFYNLVTSTWYKVKQWCYTHHLKLFPDPMPMLFQICFDIDNLFLHLLKMSVSSLMSAFIVFGLILGSIGLSVFLVFQIQLEVSYTVGLVTQVLNSTVVNSTSWVHSILGAANTSAIHTHLEQFADQGFHYGRSWLSNQVQSIVNDSAVNEQVLQLYDKLYHMYVFQNITNNVQPVNFSTGHNITMEGLRAHFWHEAKHFVSENYETVISVLKSLWSIFSVNLSVGLTLLTALSSFIFSGGTLLFNFVVFITMLFYLLAYSEDQYLPIKWIINVLPNFVTESSNNDYANTLTRVVQSVFYASLRRAFFYGLYTWLVLSLFDMKIIFLPSVLAAVAGAVPFVGPYWVGLPAILQLWLIEGYVFLAFVALCLFMLPPYMVDPIINSGIEGSHPYLTGLAIVGGMYFAGLEGAIIGPILLCCLLFVVNLLTESL